MATSEINRLLAAAAERMHAGDAYTAYNHLQAAQRMEPRNVRVLGMLGILAAGTGETATALKIVARTHELEPNNPTVLLDSALVYAQVGQIDEAIKRWERVVKIDDSCVPALFYLAAYHHRNGELLQAIQKYRKVIRLAPNNTAARSNLGHALKDLGEIEESIVVFRSAIDRDPTARDADSNLAYAVHFDPAFDRSAILRVNKEWADRQTRGVPSLPPLLNDPSPDRPLRVGYVSPNFRDHSESFFVLPLFRATDRDRYVTVCYSCSPTEDEVTRQLREHSAEWKQVERLNEAQLAQQIRDDRIDVLVDLTQHMAGNRLLTFAMRAAPVQVAWLAYPSTTGLSTMDYRITDPYLEVAGDDPAKYYTEKSVALSQCYWCYEPIGVSPDVAAREPDPSRIVFGCLNHVGKVSQAVLEAWGRILKAVPNSKLILLVGSPEGAPRVLKYFASVGISSDRIDCRNNMSREKYLDCYNEIDVALDSYPYNGATTTCDALWMGVPVISCTMDTAVSRAGLSILSNIGLPELVASDPAKYVGIATAVATDFPRLLRLRSGLRERMQNSPVMNSASFAAEMETAYRQMWRDRCARQPASS